MARRVRVTRRGRFVAVMLGAALVGAAGTVVVEAGRASPAPVASASPAPVASASPAASPTASEVVDPTALTGTGTTPTAAPTASSTPTPAGTPASPPAPSGAPTEPAPPAPELVRVPSRVEAEQVRAVHVSFYGWADASLREPVLAMAERGQINAVQLDLKDESGQIGYRTGIERARAFGAAADVYDLDAAVAELHARGVHVIGRIVAFRDPVLVAAARERGELDLVVQRADGQPYTGYGGFANFANPVVREYNIAVATEAAAAGVDAILWDYIRRPDGSLGGLRFPGLEGTPEQGVAAFVAAADEALAPYGVEHGASVYGIAATRPTEIAQDIPAMADHLDYVAPMVYPSHWGPGEYGVADPEAQPYDITLASLRDFARLLEGERARLVPWLQDFSLRIPYGEAQVRAQLSATADAGVAEWIMWDPAVRYTGAAYDAGTAPPTVVHLPPPQPAAAFARPT